MDQHHLTNFSHDIQCNIWCQTVFSQWLQRTLLSLQDKNCKLDLCEWHTCSAGLRSGEWQCHLTTSLCWVIKKSHCLHLLYVLCTVHNIPLPIPYLFCTIILCTFCILLTVYITFTLLFHLYIDTVCCFPLVCVTHCSCVSLLQCFFASTLRATKPKSKLLN